MPARRPLDTMSTRMARRAWGEWVRADHARNQRALDMLKEVAPVSPRSVVATPPVKCSASCGARLVVARWRWAAPERTYPV